MPHLEAETTYEHWNEDKYPVLSGMSVVNGGTYNLRALPNLPIFVCPSSPSQTHEAAQNSYVATAGATICDSRSFSFEHAWIRVGCPPPRNPASAGNDLELQDRCRFGHRLRTREASAKSTNVRRVSSASASPRGSQIASNSLLQLRPRHPILLTQVRERARMPLRAISPTGENNLPIRPE